MIGKEKIEVFYFPYTFIIIFRFNSCIFRIIEHLILLQLDEEKDKHFKHFGIKLYPLNPVK